MFKEFPKLGGHADIGRDELNAILVVLEQFQLPGDNSFSLFVTGLEGNLYIKLIHEQQTGNFEEERGLAELVSSLVSHRKTVTKLNGRPWFSLEIFCYPVHPSTVHLNYEFNPLRFVTLTYEDLLVELLQYPRELRLLPAWYKTALQLTE